MDRRSDFYATEAGRCRIRTLPHKAQVPYAARPWARKTAFEFPILRSHRRALTCGDYAATADVLIGTH